MIKKRLSMISAATALLMASATGAGQVAQSVQLPSQQQVTEIKGTTPKRDTPKKKIVVHSGGLDLVHENHDQFGLTPKEYGLRFGHGNKKYRSNKLRMSHNAKIKRRKA